MNRCYVKSVIFTVLLLLCLKLEGQVNKIPQKKRKIQFSTFPGVSTAGYESAEYTYNFSINLFSGMTAGSKYLAFAFISNLGTRSSSGIQFAGLANVIGSQSYLHLTNAERRQLEKEGGTPSQKGIQIAGLLNMVRGASSGIQLTGGMNAVYRSSSGFHLAGLGNYAGDNMFGVQLASLYNVAGKLVMGTQMGAFNKAGDRLSGLQLGVINYTKHLMGKADNSVVKSVGFQIGIFNKSRTNNGVQIGLINRASRMRGVQFGLINIFTPGPYDGSNQYNGVPIGLLNLGSSDSKLRFSRSDVIAVMLEYTTGNCDNCTFTPSKMPIGQLFYKTNQNVLIAGYGYSEDDAVKWAFGYGFQRVYYFKNSMNPYDPLNKKYFFSPSLRFIHLNRQEKFDPTLSLLTQLQFEVGYRFSWFAVFVGANMNSYFYKHGEPLDLNYEFASSNQHQVWPGYVFGIQF